MPPSGTEHFMAIQFSPKLLAVALSASLLAACGGGSSDSNSQSTGQSISNGGSVAGKVIDGYVFGASVCFDSNSDSACTVSETIARSNTTGGYGLLNSSTGNLLASGGVNLDTKRNNSLTLRTINLVDGPTVRQLTPLTTLLVSIVGNSQNLNTINEAKNLINAKFALGNFDFITLDPIELSNTVAAGESLRNQALNAHKKACRLPTSLCRHNKRPAALTTSPSTTAFTPR